MSAPGELLERWALTVDGAPWRGFMASVWPVLGPEGQRWALKVTDGHHPLSGEAAALRAWADAGAPVVTVHAHDGRALLLDRLDASRDLAGLSDGARADQLLAELLATLRGVAPPEGVPSMVHEVERIRAAVLDHRAARPDLLAAAVVDRALATLEDLALDLRRARPGDLELVHFDLHHANVLATLPAAGAPGGDDPDGDDPGPDAWRVIDPLPRAGVREVEVVAPLRNRWADALAGGDPDRALRRRLDLLCEVAGLDRARAEAIAQAVAVDNVLWLRSEGQLHDRFLPPYEVLAAW